MGRSPRRTLRVPTPTPRDEHTSSRAARHDSQPPHPGCQREGWHAARLAPQQTHPQEQSVPPGEVGGGGVGRVVHCPGSGPSPPSPGQGGRVRLPPRAPHFQPHTSQQGAPWQGRRGRHPRVESTPGGGTPRDSLSSPHPGGRGHLQEGGTPGCVLPAGGTSFPGTRISAPSPEGTIPSLCSPSEGECIQGDLYLMGEGSSLHPEPPMGTQNPSSLRVGTPPGEGVPLEVHSSRGAPPVEGMRYSEVGTGEGYPRVRYEGGGWVGRGDRRGVRHPHQARFPYNSSRPRHTPRRDTLHPPTPLKPRPTSPRNTSHTHSEHTKPPIRTHKTYVLHTQNHALHQ